MTAWAPRCYFQEGLGWPCGRACWVACGLLESRACLGPGSRAVPWVEEVAPVGSRAATCPSSPLGRPPSFSAALWMKCPDGQGPAGRGLGRAWNSPCSGIHFGQRPGSRGRFHLLASEQPLCLLGGRKTTSSAAGASMLWVRRGAGASGCLWLRHSTGGVECRRAPLGPGPTLLCSPSSHEVIAFSAGKVLACGWT